MKRYRLQSLDFHSVAMAILVAACGTANDAAVRATTKATDTAITVSYDRFKDVTDVSSPVMPLADSSRRTLYVLTVGTGRSISHVFSVTFAFDGGDALRYADGFDVLLDGKARQYGEGRHSPRGFALSVDMPVSDFRALTRAHAVELSVGGQQYTLTEEQKAILRKIAAKIPR